MSLGRFSLVLGASAGVCSVREAVAGLGRQPVERQAVQPGAKERAAQDGVCLRVVEASHGRVGRGEEGKVSGARTQGLWTESEGFPQDFSFCPVHGAGSCSPLTAGP